MKCSMKTKGGKKSGKSKMDYMDMMKEKMGGAASKAKKGGKSSMKKMGKKK